MKRLRSRIFRKKEDDAETATDSPTDSIPPFQDSNVSDMDMSVQENHGKGCFRPSLLSIGGRSNKGRQQPPIVDAEPEATVKINITPSNTQPQTENEPLLSERLNFERDEDPNHERKLKAIDHSIQIIGYFDQLADIVGLVVPDALGLALEKITAILEKLKVRCVCNSLVS